MRRVHIALLVTAAWAGVAAGVAGSGPAQGAPQVAADPAVEGDYISAPELAVRLIAGDAALRVFDLRSAAEFEQMHIPTATHASIETLLRESFPPDTTVVLYSEGDAVPAYARLRLRLRGYQRVFVLREGLYEWIARVVEPRLAVDASPAERAVFEQAAASSRFFGGIPRADVPRSEVPSGYWTGAKGAAPRTRAQAIAMIRRRGC